MCCDGVGGKKTLNNTLCFDVEDEAGRDGVSIVCPSSRFDKFPKPGFVLSEAVLAWRSERSATSHPS
jgi:hypothetical protein